jgi:hypothetical protein
VNTLPAAAGSGVRRRLGVAAMPAAREKNGRTMNETIATTERNNAPSPAPPAPLAPARPLSCPSARPDGEDAVIFGVVTDSPAGPRVGYLERQVRPTGELLAVIAPAEPGAVFRFGGRCAESACSHFAGSRCSLGERLVQLLPPVTERLPPCALRPTCRWFAEQGAAACRRCPQVISHHAAPSADMALAAEPPA